MSLKPASTFTAIRTPIADPKSGLVRWEWIQKFQEWELKLQNGLNQIGQFVGTISADATIGARTGTIGSSLQHIDPTGVLSAAALSGVVPNVHIPTPAIGTIGGVQATAGTAHEWVVSIDTSGMPITSQPTFADIAGSASAAQLPMPTLATLGGVEANAPVTHQWVNAINTSGIPQLSQPAFTDISGAITTAQLPASGQSVTIVTAKLTGGGANGSMTFTNGILTASTPAT